jgi:hypothetical protein
MCQPSVVDVTGQVGSSNATLPEAWDDNERRRDDADHGGADPMQGRESRMCDNAGGPRAGIV